MLLFVSVFSVSDQDMVAMLFGNCNFCAGLSTLFLTLRVYPWFIAVVGYALPVELVELGVYARIAVMLAQKRDFNTKKVTKWTKIGGGYTVQMF